MSNESSEKQLLDLIVGMINAMKIDLEGLARAQEVSNLLAVANNSMVSEGTRQSALDIALSKMGMERVQSLQTEADRTFEEFSNRI